MYRVRKNGYACDLEEHELHIRCVAAPIWDHAGAVNASLSITAPVVRMAVTRLRQLAPLIQTAGLQISRELGYRTAGYGSPARKNLPGRPRLRDWSNRQGLSVIVVVFSAWQLGLGMTRRRAYRQRSMCNPRICWFSHPRRTGFPTTGTIPAGATAAWRKSIREISRDCVRNGFFMRATRDGLRSLQSS